MTTLVPASMTAEAVTQAQLTAVTGSIATVSGNVTTLQTQKLTAGTGQATTSGTTVDFTGIPSWVKRITVVFNGISNATGSTSLLVQIGSGSVDTTGYLSAASVTLNSSTTGAAAATNGFAATTALLNTVVASGQMVLTLLGGNLWIAASMMASNNTVATYAGGGSKSLSAALDRVRVTWSNGTDTFDAGSVNILYE